MSHMHTHTHDYMSIEELTGISFQRFSAPHNVESSHYCDPY